MPGGPARIGLRDVVLRSATPASAVVSIGPTLARQAGCAEGAYELRPDDRIGRKNVVLASLDGVVLLERDGALHYLLAPSTAAPVFRLTWQGAWTLGRHRKR